METKRVQEYAKGSPQSNQKEVGDEVMARKGIYTLRDQFSTDQSPVSPRHYNLDNGDFELNYRISYIDLIPTWNDHTGSNNDDPTQKTMFFVLATSPTGATPQTTTAGMSGTDFGLRLNDSSQIGWGYVSVGYGYQKVFVDPGHIIPGDLYVNAWSLSTSGALTTLSQDLGYIIRLEQIKSSGDEALLYQIKETTTG